jgi:SAM-dependent MidA family methyltransferase
MRDDQLGSVSSALLALLRQRLAREGGWLPFDTFMATALYEPGLGYYAHGGRKFGWMPGSGSDFVTAPELSPLFGQTLAVQVRQALHATQVREVWEFGAGSGALAEQLLTHLGEDCQRYVIVELSAELRQRQQARLQPWGPQVVWANELPDQLAAVVVGNEVLDAMPVQLLHWTGTHWLERGVAWREAGLVFEDRPTALQPPHAEGFVPGTVVEIHRQAEAFVRTLGERLQAGAAFFIDYGFPQAEYYHPQRTGGTLMCHRAHQADAEPLQAVGEKDITAHVNFTGIALAAQALGLGVLGYTSQGRFLLNCGLGSLLEGATLAQRAMAARLVNEHEMGELFKVLALVKGPWFDACGFTSGDRTHRL